MSATPEAASGSPPNNPWNTDQPWSVDNIWTVSQPITSAMGEKIDGPRRRGWLEHTYDEHLRPFIEGEDRPGHEIRTLVLGSTELEVEKALWGFGYPGAIVSADIADKAMERSRNEARALGKLDAHFVVADLNTAVIPGPFDIIIANGILHHIVQQERCLDMLSAALAPGGLLVASEFTGPYRFQMTRPQVALVDAFVSMAPAAMRYPPAPDLPGLEPFPPARHDRRRYRPRPAEFIAAIDPTEAISGHTLDANLLSRFDVVRRVPVGGTLTTYLHEWLDYRTTNQGPMRAWMEAFVAAESRLIADSVIPSDYTFYVLRKRA